MKAKIIVSLAAFITAVTTVSAFAAKKESRPILCCINFKCKKMTDSIYAVATDSTALAKFPILCDSIECDADNFEFNIPAKELVTALAPYKKYIGTATLSVNTEEEECLISIPGKKIFLALDIQDYPVKDSYLADTVKPKPEKDSVTMSIGLPVLKMVVDSIAKSGADHATLTIPIVGGNNWCMRPAYFKVKNDVFGQYEGLVTPLRTW